jgi:hypothetical protein
VCLNGREWLARQLDAAGLEYVRQDNCFPWIADWAQAQRLMDRQVKANWPRLLDGLARQTEPQPLAAVPGVPGELLLVDVSERVVDLPRFRRRFRTEDHDTAWCLIS